MGEVEKLNKVQSKRIALGCGVTSRSKDSRSIPFRLMDARRPPKVVKTDHRQHFLFLARFQGS